MQASTNYQSLYHRKAPTSGGVMAQFVAINEQSDIALSSVNAEAPAYSQDEVASVKEEESVQTLGRRARSPWADWKWELLLLLLSILSFVATVITLYRLNNTSLDSWSFFLGLNTVVSILAAISRAALAFAVSSCVGQAKWNWYCQKQDSLYVFERFDQASRGPWGSFRLLGAVWIRHWSTLGALVIIIILAYEPFMQTIIAQYGILDIDNSGAQAITGQCLRVDSGQLVFTDMELMRAKRSPPHAGCPTTNPPRTQPDFGMTTAVYNGFQSASKKQSLRNSDTYLTTRSTKKISMFYDVTNMSTTATFVLFQGLLASDAYIQRKQAWQDSQPTAFECQLSFCAKMYSSSYANGQVEEDVLESWSQPEPSSYKLTACDYDSVDLIIYDSPFAEEDDYGNSYGSCTDFQVYVPAADRRKYGLSKDLNFNVSQTTARSMIDWLEYTFGSQMIYPATAPHASLGIAEILYNSPLDSGGQIDGVSLTGTDTNPPHIGTTKRWAIHYGVRWPFLVLPLVLEVAGALYVGFTIGEAKRLGVEAWKDSALATLVYGLEGGQMKRTAREMRIGMVGDSIVRVVHVPELEPDELLEDSDTLRSYGGH
ncbi:D-arabinitol 2-dehydrogenase [Apiospora saccharicola]